MIPLSTNFDVLSRLMDAASLRHKVIAQNVANVNTPGYRELDVTFEDAFGEALADGDRGAALALRPEVVEGTGGPERADGNNVDIDFEMARLTKNTLLYRSLTQVLTTYVAIARSAVSGR